MQVFLNRDHTPPDGFYYRHPETGFESRAIDIHTWMEGIHAHRKANALPPITEEQATEQNCLTLPPGWCRHAQPKNKFVNTRLRWGDIVEGAKAYIALIASGFQTVSQEEADRRAKVCSSCYLRVQPQGCGSCVKLSRIIVGDIARKKTAHDNHLANRACGVCACPLASVVWFPMSALDKTDSPEKQAQWPSFCWRQKTSVNYQPDAT